MDKKKAIEHSKKAVGLFFKIRRGFKIYIAFATGILSAIAIFKDIYEITENTIYSIALSVLLGAFITTVMLLIMELNKDSNKESKESRHKATRKIQGKEARG